MPAVTVEDTTSLPRVPQPAPRTVRRRTRSVTTAPSGFEGEGFPVRRPVQQAARPRGGCGHRRAGPHRERPVEEDAAVLGDLAAPVGPHPAARPEHHALGAALAPLVVPHPSSLPGGKTSGLPSAMVLSS